MMAQGVLALLTGTRAQWEPLYAKLVPDYTALQQALAAVDGKAERQGSAGSEGYTDAKDKAEDLALDATTPVLQGLKALQLDAPQPERAKVAGYTRAALEKMRDQALADALADIGRVAAPLAAALAEERVTATQLEAQRVSAVAFGKLVGTPRGQIVVGSSLRRQTLEDLAKARTALERLDVRIPNLRPELPELVSQYQQLRQIVNAGGS